VIYNCSAYVEKLENGEKVAKGNVTEVGLLNYFTKQGIDVDASLQKKTQNGFFEFLIPFSSSRKRATSAVRNPRTKQVSVFVKGAPEIVIDLCDRYLAENGEEEDLD
jgi:magnesium-transporting ATPase (P-type)